MIEKLAPIFVDPLPDALNDGVLYISTKYAVASHLCCCGCGREVVTPLGKTDWAITFDGEDVSMWPSVGNWSFPCRSHYIVEDGHVRWARAWTDAEVQRGRERDLRRKSRTIGGPAAVRPSALPPRSGWRGLVLSLLRRSPTSE